MRLRDRISRGPPHRPVHGAVTRPLAARAGAMRLSAFALLAIGVLAIGKSALVLQAVRGGESLRGGAVQAPPTGPAPASAFLAEPAAGPDDEEVPAPAAETVLAEADEQADRQPTSRMFTPSELEALSELAERRRALDERESELDLRAALLDDAEAKLRARLAELEVLRGQIAALIDEHDEAEAAKLARLVKIYESMKPKAAAEIFDRLDMGVLIQVVSRMREGVSSEVIGRMNPERAKSLTAELARRRRLPELDQSAAAEAGG